MASPSRTPWTSSAMAVGWSPFGSNSETMRKGMPPSDFSGRGGRCGTKGLRPSAMPAIFSSSALTVAVCPIDSGVTVGSVMKPDCGACARPDAGLERTDFVRVAMRGDIA